MKISKIIGLTGAEVTTKEEVHCLAFFEFENQLTKFQQFLDKQITKIPNHDGHFGYFKFSSEKDVRKHYVLGKEITLIRNSDAHYLEQIGEIYTKFYLEEICFSEIKCALNQKDGRFVKIT